MVVEPLGLEKYTKSNKVNEDIITLDNGEPIMVQYVEGSYNITPTNHDLLTTELVVISQLGHEIETLYRSFSISLK